MQWPWEIRAEVTWASPRKSLIIYFSPGPGHPLAFLIFHTWGPPLVNSIRRSQTSNPLELPLVLISHIVRHYSVLDFIIINLHGDIIRQDSPTWRRLELGPSSKQASEHLSMLKPAATRLEWVSLAWSRPIATPIWIHMGAFLNPTSKMNQG